VEVEGIKFTGVRVKIVNEKTHGFRRHKELESTIAKKRSLEMAGRATNGGLKDERHRIRCELEFASAKSNNQSKRRGSQIGPGNWSLQTIPDLRLDFETRGEGKARELRRHRRRHSHQQRKAVPPKGGKRGRTAAHKRTAQQLKPLRRTSFRSF
jgi:hypothetical protein